MLYRLGSAVATLPPAGRYWIAPNAVVAGRVVIGEDVGFWFGAVARGDNEPITIGARSNIQDNCVLHSDPGKPLTIGEGCTIGHMAMLHGCTIGDNSLVGIGAVILNGAVIGRNCIIGAKALVAEGKVIPDNSLVVGVPGRVARVVTAEEIARLTRSAAHYVENWRRFAGEMAVDSR